jgi:hypothetical protein
MLFGEIGVVLSTTIIICKKHHFLLKIIEIIIYNYYLNKYEEKRN